MDTDAFTGDVAQKVMADVIEIYNELYEFIHNSYNGIKPAIAVFHASLTVTVAIAIAQGKDMAWVKQYVDNTNSFVQKYAHSATGIPPEEMN